MLTSSKYIRRANYVFEKIKILAVETNHVPNPPCINPGGYELIISYCGHCYEETRHGFKEYQTIVHYNLNYRDQESADRDYYLFQKVIENNNRNHRE
jgi:hypothetical protein